MWRASFFVLVLAVMALPVPARADLPVPVAEALRRGGIPQDAVSVYVRRVDQAQPLIDHRAAQPMNPASVMKLVTTYAALDLLGPAFSWRTELYAAGNIEDEVLDGDLIIKGNGDPALDLERFWSMLRNLRQKGIRDIRGDLVLDRSYFATSSHDPAAFDGEPYRAYNAGPDALLINNKVTRFQFHGDPERGRVEVLADPDFASMRIDNRLRLRDGPCGNWKERLAYKVTTDAGLTTVSFSGQYAQTCGDKILDLSVMDDASYTLHLFRRLWQEQGGTLRGALRTGVVPPSAVKLMDVYSPPLAEVVRMINKYSNNVMARQLLLTLASEQTGLPGSEAAGQRAIAGWLERSGMRFPELVIENGSGLSRTERISAEHIGQLLLHAWTSPVMPELMSPLPLLGQDGTTNTRMKQSAVAGRAHLKTGSINGSRALAGYLLDAGGQRWVVVFMASHPNAGATRAAQDALLDYLYPGQ